MIKSDKQLTITRRKLAEFQDACDQVKAAVLVNPVIRKARMDALMSQIEIFEKEIHEYESLKASKVSSVSISSIKALPEGLIKTRIIRGWSQAVLAEKLGVAEQQVQRDEMNNYEKASLARIAEIATILDLDFHGCFHELTEPSFDFSPEVRERAGKAEQKVRESKCLLSL